MFESFQLGLEVALSWQGLLMCAIGVMLGTLIGVLPGVGVLAAVSLLLPLTYGYPPAIGLIMLSGVFYGAAYGGSTTAILLNLPGTANTAVTCLDGYPMSQKGRGGVALFISTIASFLGSIAGAIVLATLSIPLAAFARSFGAQEYFAVIVMAIVAASAFANHGLVRALTMTAIGLLIGMVGIDLNSGVERYTFGAMSLYDGMPIVALAIGLFGLPEVLSNLALPTPPKAPKVRIRMRDFLPSRDEWRRSVPSMGRGMTVGSVMGIMPGAGSLIASFISYSVERNSSKTPEEFGEGAIEGVAGPETANNAAIQTAFIPTLSLGVPGDSTMAIVLAALIFHGISPGPNFPIEHPDIFWGLIVSFLIGNLMLLVLNLPMIGLWVRVLSIPYTVLVPCIVVFSCIGVYSVRYSTVDILLVAGFGLFGYLARLFRLDAPPLLLGFVLGPMMEENFRRTLLLSRGDVSAFFNTPLVLGIYGATILLLVWTGRRRLFSFAGFLRKRRK
ncbi:tripartite tricarboxylate transporter permease [Frigidibacter sp. ROC022]|uniref:tripartite tricarboxylate transporter permease n=1 Tax=Frigidibacter sp. ROC022 TaxID=2971796 RepID=UPI00215AD312|nr:tripartite tricarboxylate transporter permease [Frigidibacter sp. ROC022]MCR8724656.1 tripartite tricarboxylate transporter permease [Frigidibacter sp. ROC022]